MEYRYHPIIEGLKVNENGTEILLNGVPKTIKEQKLKHTAKIRKIVMMGPKTVNTIRLVCEAWHGIAPTGEHAARRIDEKKGDHYSNLFWGKKGMTISSAKTNSWNTRKLMSKKEYSIIQKRHKNERIRDILEDMKLSTTAYYNYRKKYVKKDK
jgi:hypothetical protein